MNFSSTGEEEHTAVLKYLYAFLEHCRGHYPLHIMSHLKQLVEDIEQGKHRPVCLYVSPHWKCSAVFTNGQCEGEFQ